MKTLFAKIIDGELPGKMWHRDKEFVAILDITPDNPGHTLLIPREVKENILAEDKQKAAKMINLAQDLSIILKDRLGASGIKIIMNNGASAGQEVFHTHMHLIPYYDEEKDISINEVFELLKWK